MVTEVLEVTGNTTKAAEAITEAADGGHGAHRGFQGHGKYNTTEYGAVTTEVTTEVTELKELTDNSSRFGSSPRRPLEARGRPTRRLLYQGSHKVMGNDAKQGGVSHRGQNGGQPGQRRFAAGIFGGGGKKVHKFEDSHEGFDAAALWTCSSYRTLASLSAPLANHLAKRDTACFREPFQ